MQTYLLALIFPILSFTLQIYPRVLNRYFGVDVWTMLIEADVIRKNRHQIPRGKIGDGFIFDGYFDYPPIFPTLLSFLSKKRLEKYQGFISPFFDVLLNVLVFFLALFLTRDIGIALISQLIYTVTPVSALENSSLLARSLGYLLFSLAFFFLLIYTTTNPSLSFLVGGILFSTLTLLTHKFSTQSLFFVSMFFTFLDHSAIYLISLALSIILAIVVSRGLYLRVLKSHVTLIYFWFHNYKNRFAHQIYGNLPPKVNPDLMGMLYKLLARFAPLTLLVSNVWVISAFLLLLLPIATPLLIKMSLWVLFFYAFGVVVLLVKILTPIGEGYRYLEMTLVPTSILSAYEFYYFFNSPYRIYAVIILSLLIIVNLSVIIFLQIKAVIKDKNRTLTSTMTQTFDFINKLPGKPRIMCIPHQITTMLVYNTKAMVLVNFDTTAFEEMSDFYPVLKRSVKDIVKKYQIEYLIVRESFVKLSDLKLKSQESVFQTGDIQLISVKPH